VDERLDALQIIGAMDGSCELRGRLVISRLSALIA
jgi:hypothetical protein